MNIDNHDSLVILCTLLVFHCIYGQDLSPFFLYISEQDDHSKWEVLGTFKNLIYGLHMFLSERRTIIRNWLRIYSQTYIRIGQENMVHSERRANK